MSTLILTCSTGQGHNSCADAIKDYFEAQGEPCEVRDALAFVSKPLSRFICWGHVTIYRHLHQLFRIGYGYSEKHSGMFEPASGIYKLLAKGADPIRDCITEGGYTRVICTHVFASLMITELQKRYHLPIAAGLVATDYTCNPGTKESTVNLYFIPDMPLSVYYECPDISDEQIISSGIPIRQMFYKQWEKAEAKAAFHIPASHQHLLMMCGSMGCGPMKKLTGQLLKKLPDTVELTVICGTNKALKKKLTRKYGHRKNLHILGYVDNMSQMMDSADLYLTKPGGISVTEAANKNLPMVFIDAVAGCEEYNKIYFIRRGAAKTGTTVRDIADICVDILGKPKKLKKMRQNLESMDKQNAAQVIYEEMKKLSPVSDPAPYAPKVRTEERVCLE